MTIKGRVHDSFLQPGGLRVVNVHSGKTRYNMELGDCGDEEGSMLMVEQV